MFSNEILARHLTVFLFMFCVVTVDTALALEKKIPKPKPDTTGLCVPATVLCLESCDAAQYTAVQRGECASNCKSAYDRCVGNAAMRGKNGNSVGDMGSGGVLMQETAPVQSDRKKPKNTIN